MTRKTAARRSRLGILAALGLMACQLAAAAPLSDAAIRAKVAEGVSLAAPVRLAVNKTYLKNGPSDMTCTDYATCSVIGASFVYSKFGVDYVLVDSSGVIRIEYKVSVLPYGQNILALTPVNSRTGAKLNLHTDRRAPYVWDCGTASTIVGFANPAAAYTTVPAKYLPADCKKQ